MSQTEQDTNQELPVMISPKDESTGDKSPRQMHFADPEINEQPQEDDVIQDPQAESKTAEAIETVKAGTTYPETDERITLRDVSVPLQGDLASKSTDFVFLQVDEGENLQAQDTHATNSNMDLDPPDLGLSPSGVASIKNDCNDNTVFPSSLTRTCPDVELNTLNPSLTCDVDRVPVENSNMDVKKDDVSCLSQLQTPYEYANQLPPPTIAPRSPILCETENRLDVKTELNHNTPVEISGHLDSQSSCVSKDIVFGPCIPGIDTTQAATESSHFPSPIVEPCSSPTEDHSNIHYPSSPPECTIAHDSHLLFSSPSRVSLPSSSPKVFSSSPIASSQSSEFDGMVVGNDCSKLAYVEPEHDLMMRDATHDLLPSPPIIPSSSPCQKLCFGTTSKSNTVSSAVSPSTLDDKTVIHHEKVDSSFCRSVTLKEATIPTIILAKRKRSSENDEPSISPNKQTDIDLPVLKRMQHSPPHPVPTTKRLTLVSQKLQHKKLTSPFRSPLMKNKPVISTPTPATSKTASGPKSPNIDAINDALPIMKMAPLEPTSTKVRTKRAAAQFKSPLSADNASTVSLVRLTPTIQTLERKLQLLKRAVKVKKDGEEELLENLVKKWTEAGREVAYELWGLLKDMGGGDGWNGKEVKKESWGWGEDKDDGRESHTEEKSKAENYGDEERRADTLGTMLKQLGVAPETLGWNDEEELFIGE